MATSPPTVGASRIHPTRGGTVDVARGDLFWIAAHGDRGVDVPHPHLVVQDDVLNRSRLETVVVCALTPDLRKAAEPGSVLLDPGEGGLPRRSVVVVSQVSAVAKSALRERIGALSGERVDQVLAGLAFQQAAFLRGR